jgi:hypothetical protein
VGVSLVPLKTAAEFLLGIIHGMIPPGAVRLFRDRDVRRRGFMVSEAFVRTLDQVQPHRRGALRERPES